jgi:hypothetical protein
MPFYQGNKENVLPVYENSFYFGGYIAQALQQLKGKTFDHYMVIGDDLILNPEINEKNYKRFFKINEDSAFIPGFFMLNETKETRPYRPFAPFWQHQQNAIDFKIKQPGIEVSNYLPSYEAALQCLKNHGLNFRPEMSRSMFIPKPLLKSGLSFKDNLKRIMVMLDNFGNLISAPKLPYPVAGSYSDIVIIPGRHKDKFMLYTGILAALHLFVEIAIPSALLYSMPEIVTEKDLSAKGQTYWGKSDFELLEGTYNCSLDNLFSNFPENCLYIHPVKLSRWV